MVRFGKLSTLNLQRSTFLDRPRTEAGTFADGDTAGSPADMTAAYGHPQTRPAALTHAIAGGVAASAAGALTAAALAVLKKRKKITNPMRRGEFASVAFHWLPLPAAPAVSCGTSTRVAASEKPRAINTPARGGDYLATG
jgi:hypothetical protein